MSFSALSRGDAPVVLDGVAAHVNKRVITVGDVLIAMEPARRQLIGQYAGDELVKRLAEEYRETRDGLIDRFVVLDAYDKGVGRIPEWAIKQRADDVIRESFDGDRQALLDALAEENMTFDDWRKRIEQQMIVASMRSSIVEHDSSITPGDLQQYYAAHRDAYMAPAQTHLGVIAIPRSGTNGEARIAAEAALARIRGGEDFGAVARAVSKGMKAGEGGDWGWVEPTTLRAELAVVAAILTPGTVSDVIETDTDFYIIRLADRKDAVQRSLAEAQPAIEDALRLERAQAVYKGWMARLRQDAYVRVFDLDVFSRAP